jgi:anti-sigma factor RsiW
MTDHLSNAILNALADGELTADELTNANQHLAACPTCTSSALYQSLLKSNTAKTGHRYTPSSELQKRLALAVSEEHSRFHAPPLHPVPVSTLRSKSGFGSLGWVTAAVLLLASVSWILVQRATQRAELASVEHAALITEVFDQHVATLADNSAPQVVSTDRHTVKPWFQGKIPFSFNLPEGLPNDMALDGANLTYLRDQPVAQLLYSIGKHRASVFLRQKSGAMTMNELAVERSGFHVMEFSTDDLEVVTISDVDPVRLAELVSSLRSAQ